MSTRTETKKTGWVTWGLLLGILLSSLDQTIVSTAMPAIVKEVGGFSLYSWVFTVYMLASTTTMLIYGKLADLWGRKRMYLVGLSLFLTGSALCGLSGTMPMLVLSRGVQGLGAGALMPIAMTIVADLYPPEKRGRFMGLFGAVIAVSSIMGPALGGLIVDYWNWGWVFLINLPLGIPALVLAAAAMSETKSRVPRPVDWLGAAAMSAAIGSFLLALALGEPNGAKDSMAVSPGWLYLSGVVFTCLFLWIERKAPEPLLPLQLFKLRVMTFGNMVGFFVSAGMFGAIVYIPLFVQGVIGIRSSIAGYILTPLMLAVIVTSIAGGRLMNRLSYRMILIPSLLLMAASFFLLSGISPGTANSEITLYMIMAGLGMGAVYPVIGTAAQNAVDSGSIGVATSCSQFFRSIGGTVGLSIFGTLMSRHMASGMETFSGNQNSLPNGQAALPANPQVLLHPSARSALPPEWLAGLQQVFTESLQVVFGAALVCVVIGLAASILMGNASLIGPVQTGTTRSRSKNPAQRER